MEQDKNWGVEVISQESKDGKKYAVRIRRTCLDHYSRCFSFKYNIKETVFYSFGSWNKNGLAEITNNYYALWTLDEAEATKLAGLISQQGPLPPCYRYEVTQ